MDALADAFVVPAKLGSISPFAWICFPYISVVCGRPSGETPDPMLHLLFCKGLSILSDNPDHRGNSKKGLEPLSYSLSAFATPQREEPACLPPYNLRGIASYYNRLVQVRRLLSRRRA